MTLEQLRIFVAVAERQHVTAAARALNLTQSAASAAIAAIEKQHAVKLFDRIGRGIALTPVGRIFLAEAQGLLAHAGAVESVLDDLVGLKRGTLQIVASQTIAAYWLPPILTQFSIEFPGIQVDLAIGNTQQAAARVNSGGADLGIVEGMIDDPVLARWPIGQDRLLVVGNEPFPPTVDIGWLRRARWIQREAGSGTRSSFEEQLRLHGIDPGDLDIALVLPSNESVLTAVEAGAGITALSSLVVTSRIEAGRLHAAPIPFGTRRFYGLRHKERYRSKAADALLAQIDKFG